MINQPLIDRTTLLWGIKGYATDLPIPNDDIITKYHSLWNVERSFRMTKSDLLARPIYHFKTTSITAHLLICIMALAVGKYLELTSKQTLRTILKKLKQVSDAHIVDKKLGKRPNGEQKFLEIQKNYLRFYKPRTNLQKSGKVRESICSDGSGICCLYIVSRIYSVAVLKSCYDGFDFASASLYFYCPKTC